MFDPSPYFAHVSPNFAATMLDDWDWLIGSRVFEVFRVTAMGDVFLLDEADRVYFLDMVDGKIELFAQSESEFDTKIRDREHRKRFLGTFIVRGLKEACIILGPNECYSPDVPPILGGALDNANLRPCDVVVHASILGQVHRQRP